MGQEVNFSKASLTTFVFFKIILKEKKDRTYHQCILWNEWMNLFLNAKRVICPTDCYSYTTDERGEDHILLDLFEIVSNPENPQIIAK